MKCRRVVKLFLLCFLSLPCLGVCWDTDDLELFDLVEEVNQNFYDVLGVSSTADAAELKRAYRKQSLQLHPDKNKEEDAEIRFRQLVAVYEVLKDAEKRAKYEDVLVNGLPDWKQPVYYYRRVRKLGLIEFFILISIILTTGQFITVWSIYLERRFEKQEVFRSRRKRDKKGRRGRLAEDGDSGLDTELEAELSAIRRPLLSDLLPCLLVRLIVHLAIKLPSAFKQAVETVREWQQARRTDEDADDDDSLNDQVRPTRRRPNLPAPIVETLPFHPVSESNQTAKQPSESDSAEPVKVTEGSEWTDEEISLLAKAVARYPGGTAARWEKISHMVGRSVKEVTAMSRQVKTHCTRTVDPSSQGITASTTFENILPEDLTNRDTADESRETQSSETNTDQLIGFVDSSEQQTNSTSHTVRSRKPAKKLPDRTLMISQPVPPQTSDDNSVKTQTTKDDLKGTWSQQQQRILESALNQYPKGASDRWDRIAEMVPGKTKEECIQRFKYLAELVKKKQQQKLSA